MKPARNAELLVDVVDVIPDCVVRYKQFAFNIFVAFSFCSGIADRSEHEIDQGRNGNDENDGTHGIAQSLRYLRLFLIEGKLDSH